MFEDSYCLENRAVVWAGVGGKWLQQHRSARRLVGTAPHNAGTPSVGANSTQEVDVTYTTSQPNTNYSVVTQGSPTGGGFTDATPSSGSTASGTPYCTEGTGSGYTCAIEAAFDPAVPGLQLGAVIVKNSSGEVIAVNYLYGVGYAARRRLSRARSAPSPALC